MQKEHLGYAYSKKSGFKYEFHKIIDEIIDVSEFEESWSKLLDKYNLSQNKYLNALYSNREKWAKPYFSSVFCAGMTSTQRSESANHLLKQYIPRSSPMHLFVKQYNNLLKSRNTDEGKEQHITKTKRRKYNGGHPIEVDAAEIYTNGVYKKFEDEFYKSMSLVVSNRISDTEFEVQLARPEYMVDYEARSYIVAIKDGGDFISCNCGYFQHIGMLCRHSIKVYLNA